MFNFGDAMRFTSRGSASAFGLSKVLSVHVGMFQSQAIPFGAQFVWAIWKQRTKINEVYHEIPAIEKWYYFMRLYIICCGSRFGL